jgi:hypothetical protein
MGGDEETGFDGSRPATLHNGANSTDFPTLLEAIMAWHRLRPEQAQRASIRIIGGELYEAAQISKLLVPTYPITSPRMRLQVRPNYSTTSIPDPPNPWGKSLSLSKPSGMGNLVSL